MIFNVLIENVEQMKLNKKKSDVRSSCLLLSYEKNHPSQFLLYLFAQKSNHYIADTWL